MGILKDKTLLYVTHQVEFLPAADLILVNTIHLTSNLGFSQSVLYDKQGNIWIHLKQKIVNGLNNFAEQIVIYFHFEFRENDIKNTIDGIVSFCLF